MIKSSIILLSIINFSDKICREIQTHFLCSKLFLENRAVHEIDEKKYGWAEQASYNKVHAHLTLDN